MADDDWPPGWCGLVEGQAEAFLRQLARELGPDHRLAVAIAGGRVRAIGVAQAADDVVFAVQGEAAPFVMVHLAWPEPDRRGWLARRLQPRRRWVPTVVPLERLSDLD